ncbi:MAG: Cytochrome [Actinomycetia bacterium]|jgi:cytochrome P450|nr:Cytochrome [Actinomycetes bacterium]
MRSSGKDPLPDLPLTDPAFHAADPFDTYRRLRDESPVYWCATGGFYALTRHEDVLTVSRDPATYRSGEGIAMRGGEMEVPGGVTLISTDPPKHASQRRLINRSFTKGAIAKLEPHVRDIVREALDDAPVGEPFDFVETVAARVPVIVIAELLGVPVADRDKFVAWTNASVGTADPDFAHLQGTAMAEQLAYFEEIIGQRRAEPRGDLISTLIAAEAEHDDFSPHELNMLCLLLLGAGSETTRNLIAHGFVGLTRHPDQLAQLREGSDVARVVEELLRWVSPLIHQARTVTTETELGGRDLVPGDQVVMLYGSANRDDRVFGQTAEDLDVTRDPNPHLAFGFGEHFCLGAALARLEGRVLFEELTERFGQWSLAGPPERLRSTMIRGIKRLPVVLSP